MVSQRALTEIFYGIATEYIGRGLSANAIIDLARQEFNIGLRRATALDIVREIRGAARIGTDILRMPSREALVDLSRMPVTIRQIKTPVQVIAKLSVRDLKLDSERTRTMAFGMPGSFSRGEMEDIIHEAFESEESEYGEELQAIQSIMAVRAGS